MANWRPDLLSLRLFVAVCEEESFARAAERESIVSSAISKRIAELEEACGVSLLVRGSRRIRPTPAGQDFLNHVTPIVRAAETLQGRVSQYAKGVRGSVRLFANVSSIFEFLPRDISSFLGANPAVRVDMQERVSPAIINGLRDGAADIGVCLDVGDLRDLEVRPYAADRLVLVMHPSHPLASRESVAFEDTLDFDYVALNPESGTTRWLSSRAARSGRAIQYRMYVSTFQAALHVIAENLAIGLLAHGAVHSEAARLGLRIMPVADDWSQRRIVVVCKSRDSLSGPARALLDHLAERGEVRSSTGIESVPIGKRAER